jgi:hypothetical protein
MPDKVKMGELHVQFLAGLIEARVTPGSGNQWNDPIDARANRLDTEFAFAAEGKSTLGESIAFSRPLIAKAREQAGGERPLIGLRFYGTERLDRIDEEWIAVTADDFREMWERLAYPPMMISFKPADGWTEEELKEFSQRLDKILAQPGSQALQQIHFPVEVTPVSEQVMELTRNLQNAESIIVDQTRMIADLEQKLEILEPLAHGQTAHDLDQLVEARGANIELRARIAELERGLRTDQPQSQGDGPDLITTLRDQIAELERRPTLDQHRDVINQYSRAAADRAEADAAIAKLNEENQRLTSQLQAVRIPPDAETLSRYQAEVQRLTDDGLFKTRIIATLRDQLNAAGRSTLQEAMAAPPPRLPWLSIFQIHHNGQSRHTGIAYDHQGHISNPAIESVRVEATIDSNPRLIVNEHQVRNGELYIDGILHTRVISP